MKPIRMLIMLAVMWAAGTLLFADPQSTPAPTPAPVKPAVPVPKTPPAGRASSSQAGTAPADPAQPAAATAQAEDAEARQKDAGAPAPQSKTDPISEEETDTPPKAPPRSTADTGPSPQRFTPSEQVRADFDVSFPIDI